MKKYILLLLVFVLIVAITGCSKKSVSNNGNDVETPGLTLSREGEEALSELQEKISADESSLVLPTLALLIMIQSLIWKSSKSRNISKHFRL